MVRAAEVLAQIQATAHPQAVFTNPPKRKRGVTQRIGGKLVTEIEEVA
jgi:ribonucleotide monophosphatase NagD (HAD superfamily)